MIAQDKRIGLFAATLLFLVQLVRSFHTRLVQPSVRWWEETVLGSWEEFVRTLVRQGFDELGRFINGAIAWLLSLFNYNYRDTLRKSWHEHSPWKTWWHQVQARPSTFNALVGPAAADSSALATYATIAMPIVHGWLLRVSVLPA